MKAHSHLGTRKHCDPALYERTLWNEAKGKPDFVIDLGDALFVVLDPRWPGHTVRPCPATHAFWFDFSRHSGQPGVEGQLGRVGRLSDFCWGGGCP